jgi:hypothetical protein
MNITVTPAECKENKTYYWIESEDLSILEFAEKIGELPTKSFIRSYYLMSSGLIMQLTTAKDTGKVRCSYEFTRGERL